MECNVALNPTYSFPQTPREPSRGGLLLLIALAIFLRETQTVFGGGADTVVPDLCVAVVVAGGLFRGREQGFWLGIIVGLICDLGEPLTQAIGTHMLAKAALGWLAGGLALSVRRVFILIPLLLIPLATVLDVCILSIFAFNFDPLALGHLWRLMLANALLGVPVYYFVSLVPGRIQS